MSCLQAATPVGRTKMLFDGIIGRLRNNLFTTGFQYDTRKFVVTIWVRAAGITKTVAQTVRCWLRTGTGVTGYVRAAHLMASIPVCAADQFSSRSFPILLNFTGYLHAQALDLNRVLCRREAVPILWICSTVPLPYLYLLAWRLRKAQIHVS